MDNIKEFIKILDESREYKLNIEKQYYNDEFLKAYEKNYLIKEFNGIENMDISIKSEELKGGSKTLKKKHDELLSSIRIILKKNSSVALHNNKIILPILGNLYKCFFDDISKKYNLKYSGETYIYSSHSHKIFQHYYPTSEVHINKLPNENFDFAICSFHVDTKISNKYTKSINELRNIFINKLKIGGNMIIRMFFYPWDDFGLKFYLYLLSLFEKVIILFPTYLSLTKNVPFFILFNKKKEINKRFVHSNDIKIKSTKEIDNIKEELFELGINIFENLKTHHILEYNFNSIKLVNPILFKLIQNKIFTKLLFDQCSR